MTSRQDSSGESLIMRLLQRFALGGATIVSGVWLARVLFGTGVRLVAKSIFTQRLESNVWEQLISTHRQGIFRLVETELRTAHGKAIDRPIGPHRFAHWEQLCFNSCQLDRLPAARNARVDLATVIGPRARRPLRLELPLLIAGMAYGLALSEEVKIALARGATMAGTATNTGSGAFLPAERRAARHLIIQYTRARWNQEARILRQADAVEIQLGKGASAGMGELLKSKLIDNELRRHLGLRPGQDAVIESRLAGVEDAAGLKRVVDRIRRVTGGVPVGVKIAAGNHLEQDLEVVVRAGVDFVSIDGAEAGTHSSIPVLEDDFGLPTFIALARAARLWRRLRLDGNVSLLVGGGLSTPGQFLKALALGADAVYLGTAPLVAVTHTQLLKVFPYEPPTQLTYYHGRFKERFNIEQGAKTLASFFAACRSELEEAVRALGRAGVHEVNRQDLFALDRDVADIAGVALAWTPRPMSAAGKRTRRRSSRARSPLSIMRHHLPELWS